MGNKIFKKNNYSINEKNVDNHQRNVVRYLTLLMIIMLLLRIGLIVLYNGGFISVREFQTIQEPIGTIQEINIEEHLDKFPEIKNMSNINELKYKAYITNESIYNVFNNYNERLENDGNKLIYEGIINNGGISYHYYGFLKGFTLIGIIMTSTSNISYGYETMVLYTVGNIFNYREIIELYRANNIF